MGAGIATCSGWGRILGLPVRDEFRLGVSTPYPPPLSPRFQRINECIVALLLTGKYIYIQDSEKACFHLRNSLNSGCRSFIFSRREALVST